MVVTQEPPRPSDRPGGMATNAMEVDDSEHYPRDGPLDPGRPRARHRHAPGERTPRRTGPRPTDAPPHPRTASRPPLPLRPARVPLDGRATAPIRPYVLAAEREQERECARRRRITLVLASDFGIDLDRHVVGAERAA